ncbi:glycosyltransferase family 4 protein [Shinella sp.]|uniref:glycosyltransferase family 4 protein n=1 Tax=Shinella sp. TaxID=1870904 RepID=UPI0028A01918|nr:glycosyltransferase family 4 protein [Shinella sp.]
MNATAARSQRSLRLLQVLEPSGGGSGRHFIDLCRGMQARGHSVHAIYSPVRAEERFVAELSALGIAGTHIVPMNRSPGPADFGAWRQLNGVMRQAGPFDIIHGHSSKAGALARLRLPGPHVPRVYTPHAFRTMDPGLGKSGRRIYGLIETMLAHMLTDRLICVSKDEYAHARSLGMPREKLTIVVNGVETPPDDTRARVRKELGIPADALLYGFVGRLCHQKAPERLVAAFDLLAGHLSRAHLLMIGTGEAQEATRSRIAASSHAGRMHLTTRFAGAEAMAAIDVLVMPSRYEAMSYVMLEAAAAGKPLVLTDVGGASMVLKDKHNGLLIENTDNPERLAGAMLHLGNPDRLARYTAAAVARSGDYALERMIDETEAIYRSLVA